MGDMILISPLVQTLRQAYPEAKIHLLTTTRVDRGRRTVLDILPAEYRGLGLYPVGRLDHDTTGLLLLTNDGSLTYTFMEVLVEMYPYWWIRAVGGVIYLAGIVVFIYNLVQTARSGKPAAAAAAA